jgi:membrane dipeptidase
MFVFDAHLDLSMNALEWNRDLTRPLREIREREHGQTDKPDRGNGTVSLPEMRRGGIGLCVATQISRYVKRGNPLPGWHSREIAWAQSQGQLAWYRAMEEAGEMVQINDSAGLDRHLDLWLTNRPDKPPIGYVLSLEGADSILTPGHLERAFAQGLRAVGPAHYGPGIYAQGTHATGGLGPRGKEFLSEMERLGIILDATHLCDDSFAEAMDCFHGHVWASHSNCRSVVPHERQFTDEQIRLLLDRGAVIGGVLDAWMLTTNWIRGKSTPQGMGVKMTHVVDNIDHVCQLAGDSLHAGIGSDLDGCFGTEQTPEDLRSIADLTKIGDILKERGYSPDDVENIMWKNWVRKLREAWSKM